MQTQVERNKAAPNSVTSDIAIRVSQNWPLAGYLQSQMKFVLKYAEETSKIPLNSEPHCIFYRYSKEMGKVGPVSQQDIVMARRSKSTNV